jgi:hypothetical protein
MTTKCDKCGSPINDPTGIDLLAFRLRNAFWAHDFIEGSPIPAWQFLGEEEQEKWRRVAFTATKLLQPPGLKIDPGPQPALP